MLTTRVIPCLDVRDGRVVKGQRFQSLRDAGDPVERAAAYEAQEADELVVLDVSATAEARYARADTVARVRAALSVPLTVGGGVRTLDDARELLAAGADKVSVNTAAVLRPALLSEIAEELGRQCTVVAVDAARRETGSGWEIVIRAGTERTGIDAIDFVREAVGRGAGEILLTSWDRDGTGHGYDIELVTAVADVAGVPIIASGGGAGAVHMAAAVAAGADAVLAASIFHDGVTTVASIKRELAALGVHVRPAAHPESSR
ncbi:MAG: imidazole glycerol phosphate synthase subunit HisF [Myxococcales bacterium]|nr:imidazole glycerol phosphate synthase subunit HisF [Myxococcales bacterium]